MDRYLVPPHTNISRHSDSYSFIDPSKHRDALAGKTVLITGAGRGIGRATALAFAVAGANVACLSRTSSDLEAVANEIRSLGAEATIFQADVTDPSHPRQVVKAVEDKYGAIDFLINNAGTSRISTMEHETDFEVPWSVIETNMRGSLAFTHAAAPGMVARGSGTIINVVSALAVTNPPYFWAYSAAKAGMIKATHILDEELRPKGIWSYAVHPGMVADTTLGVGALNEMALEKDQDLGGFMKDFTPSMGDQLALPANTFVALCTNKDAHLLSGRYVDSCQDLEEVLEAAKRGELKGDGEGLYCLKVDML
ncbi:MAG: hypothetical protein Q9195_007015 [Heterodermia aff. obscurata]